MTNSSVTRPRVSVCVSTRNRAALLPRLVAALQSQTLDSSEFEVVVTDDGSTDDTPRTLAELAAESGLAIRVLRSETARGPAAGRNAAWRAAVAPYVAFTDDDCVPTADWLRVGLSWLEGGQRVVVGRVEPDPAGAAKNGLFAHTWVMRAAETRWFATANIFYRHSDLVALGGFDERYRNPACEDTDLGMRAESRGVEVVFAGEALVFHDVWPGRALDKVRDQARWSDLPLVFRTHPQARRQMLYRGLFWKRSHLELLGLLVGLALARESRWSLWLSLPWAHGKLCRECQDAPLSLVAPAIPGLLAVDLAELVAMIRGSVRHWSPVL